MFVLVVTRQAATGELIRQTLGAEGWWVTAVADRETAVRSASDQAPQLVVIDGSVDEAGELVRFFASRYGGPGALLLASDGEIEADVATDADAVLPHEPEVAELAATAQRLLEQRQSPPTAGLPTPGQVLNAQDIFGDVLAEMEGGENRAEPPPPPPASTNETVVTELDFAPAPTAPVVVARAAMPEATTVVEARPMVIPEPTMDAAEEDPHFALPSFDDGMIPDAEPVFTDDGEVAGEPSSSQLDPEPLGATALDEEYAGIEVAELKEAEPEVDEVGGTEPEPVASPAVTKPSLRERLAAIARKLRGRPRVAAAPEPEIEAEPEMVGESEESEEMPEPEVVPEPGTTAELAAALQPKVVPEREVVSELGSAPQLEAAPEPEVVLEPEVAPEPQVALEPEIVPQPQMAAEPEEVPEPQVVPESEAAPEPAADPAPPREDEASSPPEAVPAAALPSRGSLPGGTRFWLGMAAGLLVFVVASFLLDRFFSPAPVEQPVAVTVPAIDAVDLEELVDQEMAQREAELRESLLEEERRLQQQLDELNENDPGR